jgi:thiol-disulfide isomerase/thioredoxin
MRILLKMIITLSILIYSNNIFSQRKVLIKGETINKIEKDTILFVNGLIDKKYYESAVLSSEVVKSKFVIKALLPYPHMYFLSWKSEEKNIPFYPDPFFIDSSTTNIVVGEKKNEVVGNSYSEYKKEFVPYILNGSTITDINTYMFGNAQEFDFKLANYVLHKKDSYIALWFIIRLFNENGYSRIYENSLDKFSDKIKSEKLWKIVSEEIKKIRIREDEKFPEFILKNLDLNTEKIVLPKRKFLLIDFWFSRCKPCLKQLPKLKELYEKYSIKNEFDIIGISTDKSINVELWKKRVGEYQLKWQNYLDENAFEANNEKITKFPTNFLLDQNGIVIKKNISLLDLEEFLSKNLK